MRYRFQKDQFCIVGLSSKPSFSIPLCMIPFTMILSNLRNLKEEISHASNACFRPQRWSIFRAMRCRWFIFQQRCDTDYFWKSLTSPLSRLFSLTIGNDYFSIILLILGPIILGLFTITNNHPKPPVPHPIITHNH